MCRYAVATGVVVLLTCGAALAQQSPPKTLADFEDRTLGIFQRSRGRIVDSKHLDGKALALAKGQNVAAENPRIDWDRWNVIKFDAYNPAPTPVRLLLRFRDDTAPHGYWSWINHYFSVKPGRSTVEVYVPDLRRGEGGARMLDTRPLNWKRLRWWGISAQGGDVELDNLRLERLVVTAPEGVHAFDFGPGGPPVFIGTTGVTPEDVYSDARGFGWTQKRSIWARKRLAAPDPFVQNWISGNRATFSVKVPNGKVHVWLLWADPGEWELVQHHPWRHIEAEGRKVLEERMTGEQFLDFYFHFAETEDLPGDDIYERYVAWRYKPATFTVDVADGRLDLTLNGPDQYACTVNGIVVTPESKKAEGEAWVASLQKRRREAFEKTWTEKKPEKGTLPVGIDVGKVLVYRVPLSHNVQVYDAPTADQIDGPMKAVISAARGEYEPFAFTLHAVADLPHLAASISDFKSADGKTLPSSAFDVGVVRYKFKRIGLARAGVYGAVPWIIVEGKTSSAKRGMNRRYWITVHVPEDQPAGVYNGEVRITGSAKVRVPVTVRVLPLALPEADMGLGMFAMGNPLPHFPYFPENRARNEADKRRSLACGREHGFTYWAIPRGLRFTGFKDGKAQYDVSAGRAQVQLAGHLGFTVVDLYGDRGIARQALNDKGALARRHGFATTDALVKEVFGAAKRAAAAAGLPDPVWSFGDEPPDTQAPVLVDMHRRIRELANARSEISWSPRGKPTHELLDVTSICSLNVTNLDDIKRAQAAGNIVYLNNQGRSRWAYGLYMWKARQAGVRAYQQFCWVGTRSDPYYPLDGHEDDGGHVYPDRVG